jgi:signal peptidase II
MTGSRRAKSVIVLLACLATIGCDRLTKHVAATMLAGSAPRSLLADTVRLSYAENTGGFLSLGANLTPARRVLVFTIATGLLLLGLGTAAVRAGWQGTRLAGVALVVAGGASNWIDRVVAGAVVDFMNIGIGPVRTGIFNVADVAIMLGVVLVVVGGPATFRRSGATP